MHSYFLDTKEESTVIASTPKLGDDDVAWMQFEDDCSLFLLSYVAATGGGEVLLRREVTIMALYLLFLVHVGETRPHRLVVGGDVGEEKVYSLRVAKSGSGSLYGMVEEIVVDGSKAIATAAAEAT